MYFLNPNKEQKRGPPMILDSSAHSSGTAMPSVDTEDLGSTDVNSNTNTSSAMSTYASSAASSRSSAYSGRSSSRKGSSVAPYSSASGASEMSVVESGSSKMSVVESTVE